MGIFPWYNPGDPILWHCPDPRMVLVPSELHISRSLRRCLRQVDWVMRYDTCFDAVIKACAQADRGGQVGTWITPGMIKAYQRLHELGFAHSAECFDGERLIGGVYGVALGRVFFAESMFYHRPNASKVALTRLVQRLEKDGYTLIDCQQQTAHTERFGARQVGRDAFLEQLSEALCHETRRGKWAAQALQQ
jgi:leucyl/phenylalanyl-tRNA--protein transferase